MAALLEVPVDSVDSAINAIEGGARRIELCGSLMLGGLTPSMGTYTVVRRSIPPTIPIFVMIRSRSGDFCFVEHEIQCMIADVHAFANAGANGFKIGVLNKDGSPNYEAMGRLIAAGKETTQFTFHRAFDIIPRPLEEIPKIVELGFARILSSGCSPNATQGMDMLVKIAETLAKYKKTILLPGGGVNESNLAEVIRKTGCSEFHASASILVEREAYSTPPGFDFSEGSQKRRKMTSRDIARRLVTIAEMCASEVQNR